MPGQDAEFIDWARRRVGTVIKEKYRVEKLLGVGGMASVYSATHRNGKRVALKVLHPELSIRGDLRTRFRREAQIANAVKHPGAVEVIDDDIDDDGSAFLVMELLEGTVVETLWEMHGRRLSPIVVLAIAREACDVLAAAHRAGVVHRDIKPENLFLTNDGQLKVLDFGLAQIRDLTQPKDTHTGMVFGTPAFMAPEQASGRTSLIDERTDLWSIGATMFTLLSGVIVHEGESAQHMVMLSATSPARSLTNVLPDAHPALSNVVDRALTWDKDKRWANAATMRDAICQTCLTIFGEDRPELPSAFELNVASGPIESSDDEDRTRTDQSLASIEEPETETTQIRDRPQQPEEDVSPITAPMHMAGDPAKEDTGWSKLRNVIETAGSGKIEAAKPVLIGEREETTQMMGTQTLEDRTQVNVTQVRPTPQYADKTSVIVRPSQSQMQAVNPQQHISNSYVPTVQVQEHPSYSSIAPAPSPVIKPRPPSLNPRRDTPTVMLRSNTAYVPWVLAGIAITIALGAVIFAIADRRARSASIDPLASAFPAASSVAPRLSPPRPAPADSTADP